MYDTHHKCKYLNKYLVSWNWGGLIKDCKYSTINGHVPLWLQGEVLPFDSNREQTETNSTVRSQPSDCDIPPLQVEVEGVNWDQLDFSVWTQVYKIVRKAGTGIVNQDGFIHITT